MKYNFKNVAFFATAILTIGAFSACSNEIENIDEPQKETKTITFTATLGEDDPLSRTSYEEVAVTDGIKLKVKWEVGDKLYIGQAKLNSTGATIYPETSGSGYVVAKAINVTDDGKTATFEFTPDENWTNGQQLNVIYGKNSNLQIQKEKEHVQTLYYNHDYNSGDDTYLKNYDFMFATTTYNTNSISDFSLKHYSTFIKFILTGIANEETINNIKVTASDKSKMFIWNRTIKNDGTLTPYGNNDNIYHKTTATSITCDDGGYFNIYFSMVPTEDTNGKSAIVTVSTDKGFTYNGTINGLPILEEGKVYITNPIKMTKQE